MPEIKELDVYEQYGALDVPQLHAALEELRTSPSSYINGEISGGFSMFTDDALPRVLAITKALRKKAASPGTGGSKKPREAKPKASSLESLA
jgi:hypothetical protein